ncbi:hypothetical protein EG329_004933 [Mollisiaceae sp. DMI_Dod_QoI]|nr:hypothetical protein EG329_004933 [Helotiales sp. DMI_Dod_QoI]
MDSSLADYTRGIYSSIASGREMYRQINFHDPHHLSVEQQTMLVVSLWDQQSWSGILFSDSGQAAHKPPWISNLPNDTTLQSYSIFDRRYLPSTDLHLSKFQAASNFEANGHIGQELPNPFRSRAHTSPPFDSDLQFACRQDPFLFAADIIRTSILSWSQLLDSLSVIDRRPEDHADLAAGQIQANKLVIDDASGYMRELLRFVRRRGSADWPTCKALPSTSKVDMIIQSLDDDLNLLAQQAQELSQRYHEAIVLLMNETSIRESQKGLSQAERTTQLTLLAFIFIPLSFFASCFGMNITEISGSGANPSLWTFVVVSVPCTILVLLVPLGPLICSELQELMFQSL